MNFKNLLFLLFPLFSLLACSSDEDWNNESDPIIVSPPEINEIKGVYILNEGNMGSNKASLDFFNYTSGEYIHNIYKKSNPNIVNDLGDVGNDIQIYGTKLYAVINASNYIEVMDAKTAQHKGEIKIPNCRYITFDKGFAYVTSYAGPISIDPNAQPGYVAKIDTANLTIIDTVAVGYQPEEMAIVKNKLYVANSGGYRVPNYDTTVSVIDLNSFKEIKKIEVGINLNRMRKDKNNFLWVTSRGNYNDIPPNTYIIDPEKDKVIRKLDVAISDMTFTDNKMYFFGYTWTSVGASSSYGIFDVDTYQIITHQFIRNGVESQIVIPYAIKINPSNGDIYITDAKNYISPGEIFCFDKTGNLKWKIHTGDIPGHLAFL